MKKGVDCCPVAGKAYLQAPSSALPRVKASSTIVSYTEVRLAYTAPFCGSEKFAPSKQMSEKESHLLGWPSHGFTTW